MDTLRAHLALKNPRFLCRDITETHSLIVELASEVGEPATPHELARLRTFAGTEYSWLEPLYRQFNGVALHGHGETYGLVVGSVEDLPELASDWKESFYVSDDELYPFQREGIAFATIAHSGNYFVIHNGKIFYSDHDGGDDAVWGSDLEDFFRRVLLDPPKFLYDAGCYTRYSDGKTDIQFIPEEFLHD